MRFDENDYLSWYIPRLFESENAVNLHSSGVPELDPRDFVLSQDETWGVATRLEQALADWLEIPAGEVVFTPGATGGNLLALLTLAAPGETVIVETPIYEPMVRQALRMGGVRRVARCFRDGWAIPLERMKELIDDGTGMVMITEPHNPSAVFSPRDDVLELASLAAGKGAFLLVNEVYRGFTHRPSYHGTAENIVVVNSLSKLFGAYWMRIGWLSAREDIAGKLREGHINMSLPTIPGASTGLAVMAMAGNLHAAARRAAVNGFSTVMDWVGGMPGVSWVVPHGIGFGCIRLPEGVDDLELAEKLFSERDVLVVPGTMFEVPGTLRISWLQAGERLGEGLGRLGEEILKRRID